MRNLMSYDRNDFPYRGIIGARGEGKTYALQNLLLNFYHKVKVIPSRNYNKDDLFIWSRLTYGQIQGMTENFLKSELEKKHNVKAEIVSAGKYHYAIYFNERLMGHLIALGNAPHYKGINWQHQRYRYFILDEFQRERSERRTFDLVYNLRSILESMTRFTYRSKNGLDFPTIIFAGNTVDESTDLLYQFDFMPFEYGIYKLRSKSAVIEYFQDNKSLVESEERSPLAVLNRGDDFTHGEKQLKMRDNVKDYRQMGHLKYMFHLQITDYMTFEVFTSQNGRLYISNGLEFPKYRKKIMTMSRLMANKGTFYNADYHNLLRRQYENNNIYFDKRLTAMLFNQNLI